MIVTGNVKKYLMINEHKQKYLDQEIFKYISALKVLNFNPKPVLLNGSLAESEINDFSKFESSEVIILQKSGQTIVSKSFNLVREGISYELLQADYPNYINFVSKIHKDKKLNSLISFAFLEKIIFKFITETKKNSKASQSFSNYLQSEISNVIKEYEIHFKVLYLDIEKNFKVGNVNFEFVDKSFFNGNKKEQYYEDFKGNVLVSFSAKAEKQKAQEIAFKKCSLAIDCLKIFFDIIMFPEDRISFDIDSRTMESEENEVLYFENSDRSKISINNFRIPTHQIISNQQLAIFNERGFEKYDCFLKRIDSKEHLTELESSICNSIQMFAKALYTSNLNQRIVEIFTQLESLVLSDSNESIINSLSKYISKLVTKDIEERIMIISIIKEMYGIRSSYIHHAKKREINMKILGKFQFYNHQLITTFIELSNSHMTKGQSSRKLMMQF